MRNLRNTDRFVPAVILCTLVVITLLQILLRSLFNIPMVGSEELSRYLFIAFIFLGLPFYFRSDGHIRLEGIYRFLPKRAAYVLQVVIQVISLLVFSTVFVSAVYTTITNFDSTTPTISIPFWVFFLPTIVGFGLLTLEHLKTLIKSLKKQ